MPGMHDVPGGLRAVGQLWFILRALVGRIQADVKRLQGASKAPSRRLRIALELVKVVRATTPPVRYAWDDVPTAAAELLSQPV